MIKTIAVLGAGTMGRGIAINFALGGYDVNLFDSFEAARENAPALIKSDLDFMAENNVHTQEKADEAFKKISMFDDMIKAAKEADFVIEVVPEILELKQDIFAQLDKECKPECIFASNTSSLKLSDMMAKLPDERKKRTMICHYYNPAHLLPIVELSNYGNMPREIFDEVSDMYYKAGKQPVRVDKDVMGMVANRIQNAMAREVYSIIENGIATAEEVDKAIKFGPCFRYATTGQEECTDMGGIDVWSRVADNLWGELEARTTSPKILTDKVAEGKLGIKTGEGFYKYDTPEKKEKVLKDFQKRLMIQLIASENYK